jgi:SAM-dependent methyltransferase
MAAPAAIVDQEGIIGLAFGFWSAKVLLSAVELGVFGVLARRPLSSAELAAVIGVHPRGALDFFDSLVAAGLLQRTGDEYANGPAASLYLVPEAPGYIGGLLEMGSARLYPVWGKLTDALRTGQPQNEAKDGSDYYENLGHDNVRLGRFLRGMAGLSKAAAQGIAQKFHWRLYATFADLGGAQGTLAVELATTHGHLRGITFDLPAVAPFFDECVRAAGLQERLTFQAGDFFTDPLPQADVYVLGHVLHNWSLEDKRRLLQRAYDKLSVGGRLVVHEALIDDERRENLFGLLGSLNMLLVTPAGFAFTGSECASWMREVGFKDIRVEHLSGPDWMIVGLK